MTTYISVADTAKLVRKTLKETFPGIKFSVRSHSYSMGASINIKWDNGPTTYQVKSVVSEYEGSTFDGMTDLKSAVYVTDENGERISYGSDHVHCVRNISPDNLVMVAEFVARRFHVNTPDLNENGYFSDDFGLPKVLGNSNVIDLIRDAQQYADFREGMTFTGEGRVGFSPPLWLEPREEIEDETPVLEIVVRDNEPETLPDDPCQSEIDELNRVRDLLNEAQAVADARQETIDILNETINVHEDTIDSLCSQLDQALNIQDAPKNKLAAIAKLLALDIPKSDKLQMIEAILS